MTPHSNDEIDALNEALDDEYKALVTYNQVINDFGPIRPFINIREAESRHIDALHRVYKRYGITPPSNTWAGNVPRFKSVKSACVAAVRAEIDNADLYDRIMKCTPRSGILTVFQNLRDASQQRHLPAFRRCLERRE